MSDSTANNSETAESGGAITSNLDIRSTTRSRNTSRGHHDALSSATSRPSPLPCTTTATSPSASQTGSSSMSTSSTTAAASTASSASLMVSSSSSRSCGRQERKLQALKKFEQLLPDQCRDEFSDLLADLFDHARKNKSALQAQEIALTRERQRRKTLSMAVNRYERAIEQYDNALSIVLDRHQSLGLERLLEKQAQTALLEHKS